MSEVSFDRSPALSASFGHVVPSGGVADLRPADAYHARMPLADRLDASERATDAGMADAAEALGAMLQRLPAADLGSLLLSLTEQAATLRLVADAHARGIVHLPASLGARVAAPAGGLPAFLRG